MATASSRVTGRTSNTSVMNRPQNARRTAATTLRTATRNTATATYLRIEPCGSMTNFFGDPSSKTAYASTALSIEITSVLMTSLK